MQGFQPGHVSEMTPNQGFQPGHQHGGYHETVGPRGEGGAPPGNMNSPGNPNGMVAAMRMYNGRMYKPKDPNEMKPPIMRAFMTRVAMGPRMTMMRTLDLIGLEPGVAPPMSLMSPGVHSKRRS